MSFWGILWPMQASDSVLLSVAIAVEQLHFKTREELRSQPGEAPELPASGGSAGREEEPKLGWVAALGGRLRSCGEWGALELGGQPGDRRCQVRSLAGGDDDWGYWFRLGKGKLPRTDRVKD